MMHQQFIVSLKGTFYLAPNVSPIEAMCTRKIEGKIIIGKPPSPFGSRQHRQKEQGQERKKGWVCMRKLRISRASKFMGSQSVSHTFYRFFHIILPVPRGRAPIKKRARTSRERAASFRPARAGRERTTSTRMNPSANHILGIMQG